MQAEYPTTDVEAFTCTDRTVFDTDGVERQRTFCRPPALTGEVQADAPKGAGALRGVHFVADSTGKLKVWSPPPTCRPFSDGSRHRRPERIKRLFGDCRARLGRRGGRTADGCGTMARTHRPRPAGMEGGTNRTVVPSLPAGD